MRSVESQVRLFRHKGLKITPQRRAIFELLASDSSHPTAEDIYERLVERMPDISRMTVYNTLHELKDAGEIVEVEHLAAGGVRYDTNTGSHHHLFCLRCHALVDVQHRFDGLEVPAAEAAGYQIVRCQVTFYGYCPNCQGAHDRPARGQPPTAD